MDQAIDLFVQLVRDTPVSTINQRTAAAWDNEEGLVRSWDQAIRNLSAALAISSTREFGFRKREFSQASSALIGVWNDAYVFGRAVYGTALTPASYSNSQAEADTNGQQLYDLAEIFDDAIYRGLPKQIEAFRKSLLSFPDQRLFARRLGPRHAEGALVSSWVNGVGVAVAEQQLFIAPNGT
jgi:hypothetical protein